MGHAGARLLIIEHMGLFQALRDLLPCAALLFCAQAGLAQPAETSYYEIPPGAVEFRLVFHGEDENETSGQDFERMEDLNDSLLRVAGRPLIGPELLQGVLIRPGDARGRLASFLVRPEFCGKVFDLTSPHAGRPLALIKNGKVVKTLRLDGPQDDAVHVHLPEAQRGRLIAKLPLAPAPFREGRLQRCAETLASELEASSGAGKARALVEKYARQLGECQKAHRVLTEHLRGQDAPVPYLLVGKCLAGKEMHAEAARFWKSALGRSSEPGWNLMIRSRLAESYRALGRLEDARDEYLRVANSMQQGENPAAFSVHYELAALHEELNEDEAALLRYRLALAALQAQGRVWNQQEFERRIRFRIRQLEQQTAPEPAGSNP